MHLIDVTLMLVPFSGKPPDLFQRLYTALLDTGVMIQIPPYMLPCLHGCLDRSRTVITQDAFENAGPGYQGCFYREDTSCLQNTICECELDTPALPAADAYRLMVNSSLFLTDYTKQFARFIQRTCAPVSLCATGSTSLSTALTVDWLLNYCPHAVVSALGTGGYASLAEVVMALSLNGFEFFHTNALSTACKACAELLGMQIPPHQPVVGSKLFHVSSGVHVNGILKDSASYEPFPPAAVGSARHILLGSHSGTSAVKARLDALYCPQTELDIQRLMAYVRDLGETQGEVTDDDLLMLLGKAKKEVSV